MPSKRFDESKIARGPVRTSGRPRVRQRVDRRVVGHVADAFDDEALSEIQRSIPVLLEYAQIKATMRPNQLPMTVLPRRT
jgi:hypothetical protein